MLFTYGSVPAAFATDLFQCFKNKGIISFDVSSTFISHKSFCSKGRLYPFQASGSNQAKNRRDRKLADCSGHGFYLQKKKKT